MEQSTIIDGRFELVSLISEGGMGSVWEAKELNTGRVVAIKFLAPNLTGDVSQVTMFTREALAAQSAWRSPQVIVIEEVLDLAEGPSLVMERLEGEDLRGSLAREGQLSSDRAISLIQQICAGMAELHGQGILHRDLKPENIFISRNDLGEERATIIDLGIAAFREPPDDSPMTDDGGISCTPHYAAPEQLDGSCPCDHRSDIYSIGVILYELLTGRRPFKNQSYDDLLVDVLIGPVTPPRFLRPEIPLALEEVVMRALARDPESRFQAVDELSQALEPFVDGLPSEELDDPNLLTEYKRTLPSMAPCTSSAFSRNFTVIGQAGGWRLMPFA